MCIIRHILLYTYVESYNIHHIHAPAPLASHCVRADRVRFRPAGAREALEEYIHFNLSIVGDKKQ